MDAALHNVPVNTSSPAGSVETSKEKGVLGHEVGCAGSHTPRNVFIF